MNKTTKEIYQENQIITESINKIMEEASTDREVLSRLRNLKTSTQTQLARSQIDYYIHQIQRKHQKKAGHVVLYIILLFYLLFILYRTYLYLHPETYTITFILGTTAEQSVYGIFLFPVSLFEKQVLYAVLLAPPSAFRTPYIFKSNFSFILNLLAVIFFA